MITLEAPSETWFTGILYLHSITDGEKPVKQLHYLDILHHCSDRGSASYSLDSKLLPLHSGDPYSSTSTLSAHQFFPNPFVYIQQCHNTNTNNNSFSHLHHNNLPWTTIFYNPQSTQLTIHNPNIHTTQMPMPCRAQHLFYHNHRVMEHSAHCQIGETMRCTVTTLVYSTSQTQMQLYHQQMEMTQTARKR